LAVDLPQAHTTIFSSEKSEEDNFIMGCAILKSFAHKSQLKRFLVIGRNEGMAYNGSKMPSSGARNMNPFEILQAWPKIEGYLILGELVPEVGQFKVYSYVAKYEDGSLIKAEELSLFHPGPFATVEEAKKPVIEFATALEYDVIWDDD
jgi:hypothetical protein